MNNLNPEQIASLIDQDFRRGIIGQDEYYRLRRIYGLPSVGITFCPLCGSANPEQSGQCYFCKETLFKNAAPAMITLKGISGPHSGQILVFEGHVSMGRDPGACNLLFAENASAISRRHADINFDPVSQKAVLKNLSGNGTFVESDGRWQPVESWTLSSGDRFCLAGPETAFVFIG